MTTKEKLHFTYNGRSSKDFGIISVHTSSGMYEETLNASRSLVETAIRGSDTPLFHSVEEEPLEFPLTLAFQRSFTEADLDDVILWLFQDTYRPLFFEGREERLYHCLPIGDSQLVHNGLRQGYITLQMRCRSSRIESPQKTTPRYNFSQNNLNQVIEVYNGGHLPIYPELSIEKVGAGVLTFLKDGEIFEIRNLTNREQLYVNCEKEIIETDLFGTYRYDDVIGEFHDLRLDRGMNRITVQGACYITVRYTLKYRF